MALLDIRQRTGWLFAAVVVSHIILISAQVTTRRGVPVLQEVTFGVFAEMQRAASSAFSSVRESWQNYFALQQIRQENNRLQGEVTELRVSLERERPIAQETRGLQKLLELRSASSFKTAAAAVIGSGAGPEFRTITIDKGTPGRPPARHGGHGAGGHRRPHPDADLARGQGSANHRSRCRGRRHG